MTLTIGRKWRGRHNPPMRCDFCGAMWPLDKLVRDSDGLMQCPQDRQASKRDLSQANAAGAREYARLAKDNAKVLKP